MPKTNGLSSEAKAILAFLNTRCDIVTPGSIARGLHPHEHHPDLPSDSTMNQLVGRNFVECFPSGYLLTPEGEKFCEKM